MWKTLTRDQEILEILPRYTVPMLSKLLRRSFPILFQKRKFTDKISHDGKEVEDLLSKRVINLIYQQKDQFLSTLFLALKKDGNQRPVINLKQLNQFIPYQHFKEGLHFLKKVTIILEYARICQNMQAGFEGYLFLCPIKQKIREMCEISLVRYLHEFICLCFGLGPAPRVFTKLLKIPADFHQLNIRRIIYL